MTYDTNTGLGVSNHYGARKAVGVRGELCVDGYAQKFVYNLDGEGMEILFPTPIGGVTITNIDTTFATGTLTTLTIGDVDVSGATPDPDDFVPIWEDNTGVIVQEGLTAGTLIIEYEKFIGNPVEEPVPPEPEPGP